MRRDVKELADAMELGYEMVPRNCYSFFQRIDGEISACCAMGHALLSKNVIPSGGDCETVARKTFPILKKQEVSRVWRDTAPDSLESAINVLMLNGWTTPRVVAWLRTHQEKS